MTAAADAPAGQASSDVRIPLWAVAVAAVALAACSFAFFTADYEPSPDAREYLELAKSFSARGELVLPTGDRAKRMPLYPVLAGLVNRWQGDAVWKNALLAIQSVMAWAAVMLLAAVAARIGGPQAGVLAGLLAALYAPFRYLQMMYLSETLVILLVAAALAVYVRAPHEAARTPWKRWALVSLFLGAAALTRADALLFIVAFGIDAALRGPARRPRRLAGAAVIVFPALCLVGVWGARNQRVLGAAVLSTSGGLNFYLGHNDDYADNPGMDAADYAAYDRLRIGRGLGEVETDRAFYQMGRDFIARNPRRSARDAFTKLRVWVSSSVSDSAPTAVLLVLLFLWRHARRVAKARPDVKVARWYLRATIVATCAVAVLWVASYRDAGRPWATPREVVPLGLLSLVFVIRGRPFSRLLMLLVAAQLAVAVAYVPLERLRWTIDGVLIVALAAAVAVICTDRREPAPRGCS